ncbi:MAG: DUF6279 family lipoprotein [Pseudomonadota bacterium]
MRPLVIKPFPLRPHAKVVLLLCSVLLISSCSSTKFVYNRLDFFLPWYLGRYVDLDREQSRSLDRELVGLLAWHREEELPTYLDLLASAEAELETTISVETLDRLVRDFETAWYRVRDRGLDALLLLGDELSNEQLDQFVQKIKKQQQKYERKYLKRNDEEFRKDAYENLKDTLSDYLGRLDKSQRAVILAAVSDLVRSDQYWLAERMAWIEFIENELKREPGWQERVRNTVIDWEEQLDPKALAIYESNTLRVQQAAVEILNSRTDKQDRRLRRELQKLKDDVVDLTAPR